jgi:hypothetical protein
VDRPYEIESLSSLAFHIQVVDTARRIGAEGAKFGHHVEALSDKAPDSDCKWDSPCQEVNWKFQLSNQVFGSPFVSYQHDKM